ncbi:MAG: hypothetical protein L6R37_005705 [Teloschistes peruensis]|nr:MAG: hypothetical protein L6R37_005705 [Teloschistes peruensis]
MGLLTDLPNEVGEMIIHQIYREDLVNLATTCKWFHALSQPALKKHRDLQQKYAKTTIVNDDFLVQITADAIKDIRIGLYVTSLRVEGYRLARKGRYLQLPCSASTLSLLERAASDRLPLPATLSRQRVRSGDRRLVVALLLQLLPNLRRLLISNWSSAVDGIFLNAALDKANPKAAVRLNEVPCLSKLNFVDLVCAGSNSFDTFERFRKIPSLRILRVKDLFAHRTDTEMNHRAWDGLSTLKALIFMKCQIDSTLMSPILESQCGLECFSYTTIGLVEKGNMMDLSTVQPDPYWVRLSLIATSRDSLQVFQYLPHAIVRDSTTTIKARRYLGSLKGFGSLTTVMVDFCLLFGGVLQGRRTLMTELPHSIRNVLLYIPPDEQKTNSVVWAEVLKHHLHWLRKGKTEHLPTLSNVMILGVEEKVVKEVIACQVMIALRGLGVVVTLVPGAGKEFLTFQRQIRSTGFYHEKPWYYEDMEFP